MGVYIARTFYPDVGPLDLLRLYSLVNVGSAHQKCQRTVYLQSGSKRASKGMEKLITRQNCLLELLNNFRQDTNNFRQDTI